MPSSSKKQHNFMAAIAHSPSFAKKVGISQGVGSDFVKADKGRKFAKGDDMATKKMFPFMGKESKAEEAKEMKIKAKSPAMYRKGEKAEGIHGKSGMAKPTKYAKGGGCELKGKTKAFAVGGDVKATLEKVASLQKSRNPMSGAAMPSRSPTLQQMRELARPRAQRDQMANEKANANPFAKSKMGPGGVNLDAQSASGLRPLSQKEFAAQRDMAKPQMQKSPSPQDALLAKLKSLRPAAAGNVPATGMNPPPRMGSMLGGSYGKRQSPLQQTGPSPYGKQPSTGMPAASKLDAFKQQMAGNKMPTGPQSSMAPKVPMQPPQMKADGFKPDYTMPVPRQQTNYLDVPPQGIKKGGVVKKFAKGGGCEVKGKTKGRYI